MKAPAGLSRSKSYRNLNLIEIQHNLRLSSEASGSGYCVKPNTWVLIKLDWKIVLRAIGRYYRLPQTVRTSPPSRVYCDCTLSLIHGTVHATSPRRNLIYTCGKKYTEFTDLLWSTWVVQSTVHRGTWTGGGSPTGQPQLKIFGRLDTHQSYS